MIRQNDLSPAPGSKHSKKRIGRGFGSGHGRYACRGLKGQKSRSGGGVPPFFEGGQLPLVKRLPYKRGFHNPFRKEYSVVNVGNLNIFEPNSTVGREELLKARLVKQPKMAVKILSVGELDRPLTVQADKFSVAAREKIVAAGGKAEVVGDAAKAK